MKKSKQKVRAKDPSQAKSMVMIPLYRPRQEPSTKDYRRREKHVSRDYRDCA
jgi:stalled ribosome alternative rescue factor ArfA